MKKYKAKDVSFETLSEEEEKSIKQDNNRIQYSTKQNKKKSNKGSNNSNIKEHRAHLEKIINNLAEDNFTNLEINDDSIILHNNDNNYAYYQEQIIDEDIEIFKKRFIIMLKNFQNETLQEIVGLKRKMAIKQSKIIESEKQKYEAILIAKEDRINNLQEDQNQTNQKLNIHIAIKEKLTMLQLKDMQMKYQHHLKQLAFESILKKHYEMRKDKKNKEAILNQQYQCRLKKRVLMYLTANHKEMQLSKLLSSKDNEWENKMNELCQYYNQEITHLKCEVKEANRITEKTKEEKNAIQDKLKKVLMKGVMAMNIEAMNLLDKNKDKAKEKLDNREWNGESENEDEDESQSERNKQQEVYQKNIFPANKENTISYNTNFKQNNVNNNNEMKQMFYNTHQVTKELNRNKPASIPIINYKNNILKRESYESEVNMEILDTCKSEELSSRQNNLIQLKPLNNTHKDNSSNNNVQSINKQNSIEDYHEEKERNYSSLINGFGAAKDRQNKEDDIEHQDDESFDFNNEYTQKHQISVFANPNYDIGIGIGIKGRNTSHRSGNSMTNPTETYNSLQKKRISINNSTISSNYQIMNNNKKNAQPTHCNSTSNINTQSRPESIIIKNSLIPNNNKKKYHI